MSGLKLLFLAIWDELKTLIFLRASFDQDVESQTNHYRANNERDNMARFSAWGSESGIADYKTNHPYQKWYQTKAGRDRFVRRTVEIFTIGAVIIYLFQMQANRRQAEAAERQLNEMRAEMMLGERAWLGVEKVEHKFTDAGDLYYIITFRNTGKTPAIKVITYVRQYSDDRLIPIKDNLPNPDTHSGLLSPDATGEIVTDYFTITPAAITAIKNGMPYFLAGTIWYEDIFGKRHWSQFCFQIYPGLEGKTRSIHFASDDAEENQGKK